MPSIKDATTSSNLAGYVPVTASPQASLPPVQGLEPTLNTMIRCPLPPIFQSNPDNLRQYYQGGKVPQNRLLSAVTTTISSSGGSGNAEVANVSVSQSGGVVPPPAVIVAKQAVITTSVMGPGAQFIGTLPNIGRTYQLLSVTSNTAARVQIYGTSFAQTADLSRALDQPPAAGSTQNIVTDIALDTAPFSWAFQDRVGANGENPQTPASYMTITNLSAAAVAITVTLNYVPIEN
jgi:hypothetical protein